jgi:hypothetical protein
LTVAYFEIEALCDAMTEYRAYVVGIDGHFIGYEPLVCANDAEAIAKAHRIDGHAVEVWSGPRSVLKVRDYNA